jgi:GNAT superfamily N-acetyltransferase
VTLSLEESFMKWTDFTETIPTMIANGQASAVLKLGAERIYSNRIDYLLRRDLSVPCCTGPEPRIRVRLRELRDADIPRIAEYVPERIPGLKELRTCYLAVTEQDDICYMQWLIDSSQNHLRPRRMGLVLQSDEMLLEWAYTFEKFRGLGIMSYAMAEIAALAGKVGARWVMTIVEKSNVASLKGCRNAGFRPHKLREERWRALRTVQTYKLLPADSKYSFET